MMRRLYLTFLLVMCSLAALGAEYSVLDSVLVIPAKTKTIPAREFADRDDFTRVEFAEPCSLMEIGEYAFLGCRNLREIDLPASLRRIGEGAFRECGSLVSIEIPMGVAALPRYAFAWCGSLESVSLPRTLADIGRQPLVRLLLFFERNKRAVAGEAYRLQRVLFLFISNGDRVTGFDNRT